MHDPAGPKVATREIGRIDLAAVAPLVAVVVALGLYPQFVVHRTEKATTASIAKVRAVQEVASR
jgi:NADH:ubiquinone oxidoreductase subunit 4 (subunit M)